MEHSEWTIVSKPYDLRERLFLFACLVVRKETRFRLQVCKASGFLTDAQDPVIAENTELVKIVAAIIRNAKGATDAERHNRGRTY